MSEELEVLYDDDEPKGETPDKKIVNEAKHRFARCSEWEDQSRKRYIEDIKFANGDARNLYQWNLAVRQSRGYGTIDERPCLTVNKVRQHCLQIINDAKQNKPSVRVKPIGNGATFEAAQVFEGIVNHIEYISNAQQAYDTASTFQVQGGIGWWRIVTDFANEDSFDQEIFIRRIKDPLTVYMDPDIREVDGSDASFAFVFDDLSREDFNKAYPQFKDMATQSPLDVTGDWCQEDHVRVAEYYRVVEENDKLVAYNDPLTGTHVIERKSRMTEFAFKGIADDPKTKLRDIKQKKVEWFLIVGNEIADRTDIPGSYIPLVRCIGEETVINGELDRKGHTRAMIDPQMIYNYWSSSAVEMVALQSKTPYVGPMSAFENLETYWDTANSVNHAWLPYNHVDDTGGEIPAPQRQEPPQMAMAYLKGMEVSSDEINAVSGQFQAELGMPSNERSGTAILQRQRQGDNATYHYIDNLAIAIRFTGKILIEWIPKVYDTKRIIKIMGEDGVEEEVTVDPQAQQAYIKHQQQLQNQIKSIFNPNVGRYDVEAQVGPDTGTKRQETFTALTELMKMNPKLMDVAGDLLFRAADMPGANVIAERLKKMMPSFITGDGPTPEVQELQAHIQSMQGVIQKTLEALTDEKAKTRTHEQQKEIDVYKAITERLKLSLEQLPSPKDLAQMQHDVGMAAHQSSLDLEMTAAQAELQGAQQQQAAE